MSLLPILREASLRDAPQDEVVCESPFYESWYERWRASAGGNSNRKERAMKKKRTARPTAKLSTLDDFLKGEGKLEEFEDDALKEVLASQIGQEMKTKNLSRKRLAESPKNRQNPIGRVS